jgi:hypothetical protein
VGCLLVHGADTEHAASDAASDAASAAAAIACLAAPGLALADPEAASAAGAASTTGAAATRRVRCVPAAEGTEAADAVEAAPRPLAAAVSAWWEKPYPGAPMVKVKGFPRPCYPPDAAEHGKTPSSPGADIEAYKRTISRAGRWPWGSFDEAFSNGFAHGKSGNVADSGVAGIQRQQNVDATGWIGQKTFNTLRSIVIPNSLPHAGEMAMDEFSVELIEEAFDVFGGSDNPPTGTFRAAALDKAQSQLGTKESPANSNHTKYGEWYGVDYQPWCAIFVTWCYEQVGDSPSFVKGSRYAYCPYVVGDARAGRYGLSTTDDPIPGDLVVYDWNWNGEYDHIGIFESEQGGGNFNAIEGNTSYSDNSNGGEVMRRTRSRSGQGTVFVRVAES